MKKRKTIYWPWHNSSVNYWKELHKAVPQLWFKGRFTKETLGLSCLPQYLSLSQPGCRETWANLLILETMPEELVSLKVLGLDVRCQVPKDKGSICSQLDACYILNSHWRRGLWNAPVQGILHSCTTWRPSEEYALTRHKICSFFGLELPARMVRHPLLTSHWVTNGLRVPRL